MEALMDPARQSVSDYPGSVCPLATGLRCWIKQTPGDLVSPKNVQLVVSVMPAVLAIRLAVALETTSIPSVNDSAPYRRHSLS